MTAPLTAGKPCFGCDQEFFPEGHVKTNFLCNLGYGDPSALHPRLPRLAFSEACSLLSKFKSPVLDTDQRFSHTFEKAGTYKYFCSIHPRMTGQVQVARSS